MSLLSYPPSVRSCSPWHKRNPTVFSFRLGLQVETGLLRTSLDTSEGLCQQALEARVESPATVKGICCMFDIEAMVELTGKKVCHLCISENGVCVLVF